MNEQKETFDFKQAYLAVLQGKKITNPSLDDRTFICFVREEDIPLVTTRMPDRLSLAKIQKIDNKISNFQSYLFTTEDVERTDWRLFREIEPKTERLPDGNASPLVSVK